MTLGFPRPPRIRILDLETTGLTPDDHVVEIGAVDLIGNKVVPVGSNLVRPPISIPPQASAIHHITDDDVSVCRSLSWFCSSTSTIPAMVAWPYSPRTTGGSTPNGSVITYKDGLSSAPTDAPCAYGRMLRPITIKLCGIGSSPTV